MIFASVFVGALLAIFCSTEAQASNCSAILQNQVSNRFPGVVAHGIHSFDVQSLRLFKADVTERNGIPTINRDLQSRDPIVHDAPKLRDTMFQTNGIQVVDEVLSHMDDASYDIRGYDALERLVHAFHMQEVWHAALPHYHNYAAAPPSDEVCHCVTDIDGNGIMKMLRFISLKIREPELMYGKVAVIDGKEYRWDGNLYSYKFASEADADKMASDEPFQHLTNEGAWKAWKKHMMAGMRDSDDKELALFLHCALRKA